MTEYENLLSQLKRWDEKGYCDIGTMIGACRQAADVIIQLSNKIKKMEHELEVAKKDIFEEDRCTACIYGNLPDDCNCDCENCQRDCKCRECSGGSNWKWKGIEE